jgi:arylsulfatase
LAPRPPEGEVDDSALFHKFVSGRSPDGPMTDDDWRFLTAQYYGLCTAVDDQVGRLLAALEEQGRRDETIIVYTSDHGEALGDHGLFCKGMFCYEGVQKVPLIIDGPGLERRGVTTQALAQSVDLSPTLLEWVGEEIPFGVQGKSLAPILRGQAEGVNDTVHSEYGPAADRRVVMTRDKRYKYVYYTKGGYLKTGGEELFDLEKDPHEFTNLALRPEAKEILERMRMKMLEWKLYSNDPLPEECGSVMALWR